MEKPTHTPGPWELKNGLIITSDGTLPISNMHGNAIRIVDCVNAMEGIEDPKKHRETWDAIQHLELDKYKNLKEAVQSLIQGIDNGMHMKSDSIIVEALRQAIQ